MRTAIEVGRDGTHLRVYHSGGKDGRFTWTHSLETRPTCEACTKGTLPAHVRAGRPS